MMTDHVGCETVFTSSDQRAPEGCAQAAGTVMTMWGQESSSRLQGPSPTFSNGWLTPSVTQVG